jgi:hypothetical protein
MKKYKIQNWSPKISRDCVHLKGHIIKSLRSFMCIAYYCISSNVAFLNSLDQLAICSFVIADPQMVNDTTK